MKFVEMFAGIGGMSYGLESAGMECVGFAEWDKFAHKAYNILHNADGRKEAWTDVTKVTERDLLELKERSGGIDVLAGGFPCQAFSVAGKRKGFEDTRGTLFFECARWASILRPTTLLFENVKGLLNHNGGETFEVIISTLDELGYDAEWQVLNSKDYVPQNRERIFIVGHLRGSSRREIFPFGRENADTLSYVGMLDMKGNESIRRVYATDGVSPSLTTMQGGNREPKVLVDLNENGKLTNVARCLTARYTAGVTNHKATNSGVIVPINPQKEDGTQFYHQDRVFDTHGIMPALTSIVQNVALPIKEATKQGYAIATEGDSINFSHPKSATRRGRVGKGIANTLETNINQGVIVQKIKVPSLYDGYNQKLSNEKGQVSPTLTLNCGHGGANAGLKVITNGYRIRKLTPLECFRLQSFPDEWYHTLVEHGFSNSQLYKMAGNAVTSKVAEAIGTKLMGVN